MYASWVLKYNPVRVALSPGRRVTNHQERGPGPVTRREIRAHVCGVHRVCNARSLIGMRHGSICVHALGPWAPGLPLLSFFVSYPLPVCRGGTSRVIPAARPDEDREAGGKKDEG